MTSDTLGSGPNEKPDQRFIDGDGSTLQQTEARPEALFWSNCSRNSKMLRRSRFLRLLRLSRSTIESFTSMERHLIKALQCDDMLYDRVRRLMTVPGLGPVLALTWALEVGDVKRFPAVKSAISYCGLCGAEQSSAGKMQRTPISKQRNKHLQTTLIGAAKVAPRWHSELAALYEREKNKGNRNRGTLAVARKLVAYLVAVDRDQRDFNPARLEEQASTAVTA